MLWFLGGFFSGSFITLILLCLLFSARCGECQMEKESRGREQFR